MEYRVTLESQRSISLMRVENGWLVRTSDESWTNNTVTPLLVAETPEALVKIVREWASGQVAQ